MKSKYIPTCDAFGLEVGFYAKSINNNKQKLNELLALRKQIKFRGGARKLERTKPSPELLDKVGEERYQDLQNTRRQYLMWIKMYSEAVIVQVNLKLSYRGKQRHLSSLINNVKKQEYKQESHLRRLAKRNAANTLPERAKAEYAFKTNITGDRYVGAVVTREGVWYDQ